MGVAAAPAIAPAKLYAIPGNPNMVPAAGPPAPPAPPQIDPSQYPPGSQFAATADGVLHVFPAGTPQNVINGAMQSYAQKQQPGYQQQVAATKGALDNPLGQIALPIENSLTFGNADRVQGAAAAAGQYLSNAFGGTDTPPSQAYAGARDATAGILKNMATNEPIVNGALGIVGSLPYGVAAGKVVQAVPTVINGSHALGMAAKGAAAVGTGADLGAGYGAGYDRNDPVTGAVEGGAMGAAAVPVVAGAGLLARGLMNAGANIFSPSSLASSASDRAAQYLNNLMTAKGITPEQIAAENTVPVAQGGKTLAEAIGQPGVAKAAALTRSAGQTGDLANIVLPERINAIARSGRLMDLYTQATGVDPTAARQGIDQLVTQGRADVNPAYAAIRANPDPVQMTPELQNLVQTDPHVQQAVNTVLANTRAPEPGGTIPQNAAFWLRVQSQLGQQVERSPVTDLPLTNSDKNFQIGTASADLTSALKGALPGYEAAQGQAAQYLAPQSAFQRAQGMLLGNGAGKQPADVQALWSSAKTPEEQQAIQAAFADDLNTKANSATGLSPNALQASGVQQKLAIVHGPEAAANIMKGAKIEATNAQTGARIIPNVGSITGEIFNHGAAETNATLAAGGKEVLGQLMAGEPKRAFFAGAGHAASLLGKAFTASNDTAFNDALGRYLLSDASSFKAPSVTPANSSSPALLSAPSASQLAIPYLTQQPQRQSQ